MSNQPEKKQSGKVNYVWVLAGGYLIYLAAKMFMGVMNGTSDNPPVGIGGGVLFVVVGVLLLYREWKAYKYGVKHIDDPETWNDDPELLEELKTEEAEDGEEA